MFQSAFQFIHFFNELNCEIAYPSSEQQGGREGGRVYYGLAHFLFKL